VPRANAPRRKTPPPTSANPLDALLAALAADPEAAPASRKWAEKLLEADATEGSVRTEETAPQK
jgi:hypothetical protein